MNELQPSSSIDPVALQMENELLALEVAHLRARLKAVDRERSESGDTPSGRESAPSPSEVALAELRAERKQLLGDMRWLLRRLNGTVAGPLLRRTRGFRTLLDRYPQKPPT